MNALQISIGERFLLLSTNDPQMYTSLSNEYIHFVDHSNRMPDLNVYIKPMPGSPTLDYKVNITVTPYQVIYERSDYRIEWHLMNNQAHLFALNNLALKHALMNLYSAIITHQSWGLLIHSSCIEQDENAYLFAGSSGAGKSTVAKLSAPRNIWSDEATILKLSEDEIRVYNSPFRSEMKTTSFSKVPYCKLKAIYLLNQSTDVRSTLVRTSDALLQVTGKVFNWPYAITESRKVIRMCKQLIETTPVHQLFFQKNNLFWELIS